MDLSVRYQVLCELTAFILIIDGEETLPEEAGFLDEYGYEDYASGESGGIRSMANFFLISFYMP